MKEPYPVIFAEFNFCLLTKTDKDMPAFSKTLFFPEECELSYYNYNSLLKTQKEKFYNSGAVAAGEVWDEKREKLVDGFVNITWRKKRIYLNNEYLGQVKLFLTRNLPVVKNFLAEDKSNLSNLNLYFFQDNSAKEMLNFSLPNNLLALLSECKVNANIVCY